jgi:xylan 1,4-beta-xylosidase
MHNDPYTLYDQLGKPSQLSKPQVDFLKENSNGMPERSELVKVKVNGSFDREIPLDENDVYLLRFKKL